MNQREQQDSEGEEEQDIDFLNAHHQQIIQYNTGFKSVVELPSELFIHCTFYLNFIDLWKRLRLCCKKFYNIIHKNQLIFIQEKKALVCLKKKDIILCEKLNKLPRIKRHDTRYLIIGSEFLSHIGLHIQVWLRNQLQQQEVPPIIKLTEFNFAHFACYFNNINVIQQIKPNKLLIIDAKLDRHNLEDSSRGIYNTFFCGNNLKTLKLINVSYKLNHHFNEQYDDETRELQRYQTIRNVIMSQSKLHNDDSLLLNLKQFSIQNSPPSLLYLMLYLVNFNNIESLCWNNSIKINEAIIKEFKLESQLIKLKEFTFSIEQEQNSMCSLNYRIIKKNIPCINKLGIHIITWNVKINKYLDIIHLCPQLQTLQITTSCHYDEKIIDWIQSTLQ